MKTRKAVRSGLYDAEHPHVSFTQVDHAGDCLAWHESEYEGGRSRRGKTAEWGRLAHAAIADVNRALMAAGPDGIAEADIERARRHLIRVQNYGLYATFCDWLVKYAEHGNAERARIIAVELEIEAWLQIGEIRENPRKVWIMDLEEKRWTKGTAKRAAVRFTGRIDRLDRGSLGNNAEILDIKTWGSIPTREELRTWLQGGLYNWAMRQPQNAERFGLNPLADYLLKWQSIYHGGSPVTAAVGVREAEMAEQAARDIVRRLIQTVARPATFHRRCAFCPLSEGMSCRTFREEIRGTGKAVQILRPSAGEYVKVADRLHVLNDMHDQMRERIRIRLEGNQGKPISEEGCRASLEVREGGLPEKYAGFTTVEEFKGALTRPARTDVVVRRTK